MKPFVPSLLMSTMLAGLASSVMAQPVVIFGDSLSDIGQNNWAHPATYLNDQGQPNWLWGQHFAKAMGSELKASTKGGTDYAYSSGVINENDLSAATKADAAAVTAAKAPTPALAVYTPTSATNPNPLENTQLKNYLNANQGSVNKNALHVLFVGGNDMQALLTKAAKAKSDADAANTIQAGVLANANLYAQAWGVLHSQGVNRLIVMDVPNVALTPKYLEAFTTGVAGKLAEQLGLDKTTLEGAVEGAYKALAPTTLQTYQDGNLRSDRLAFLKDLIKKVKPGLTAAAGDKAATLATIDLDALVESEYDKQMAAAEKATTGMNQALSIALNQVGGEVVRIPVQALFADVVENPHSYGLKNAVGVVCNHSSATTECGTKLDDKAAEANNPLSGKQKANANPENYVFADEFHPGPRVHRILSDYVVQTLQAPHDLGVISQTMQANTFEPIGMLLEENRRLVGLSGDVHSHSGFASVRANRLNGVPSLFAGGAFTVAPQWQGSLMLSHTQNENTLGTVKANVRSYALTAAIRHDMGDFWVGGFGQAMSHSAKETRTLNLADTLHARQARTSGFGFSAGAFGGWRQQVGQANVDVMADVAYTQGSVAAFSEAYLGLDRQTYKRLDLGVAVRASMKYGNFEPFAQMGWRQNVALKQDRVTVLLNGGHFSEQAARGAQHRLDTQVGVRFYPANHHFNGYVTVGKALFAQGINDHLQVGAGVAWKF